MNPARAVSWSGFIRCSCRIIPGSASFAILPYIIGLIINSRLFEMCGVTIFNILKRCVKGCLRNFLNLVPCGIIPVISPTILSWKTWRGWLIKTSIWTLTQRSWWRWFPIFQEELHMIFSRQHEHF